MNAEIDERNRKVRADLTVYLMYVMDFIFVVFSNKVAYHDMASIDCKVNRSQVTFKHSQKNTIYAHYHSDIWMYRISKCG